MGHIKPLKILCGFGWFFGAKGLIFMTNCANSVCFLLAMFFINSGQSWDSARKFVLFGLLKDPEGSTIGPDSEQYENLGIGQQIGGPLQECTGPALNNFIKFVTVFAFVTNSMYDVT